MKWQVINGNNIDILKTYPDNTFDSIVTDPPYGIAFLGKDWDNDTGAMETWQECFRVLKPGGHILAFSAARTYHHLATNIEMVGFEIRDQIMWLYGSGFPKAQDIGKAIQKRQGVEDTKTIKGGARPSEKMNTPYAEEKEYTQTVCSSPEAQQWSGWKTALKPAHEPIVMARKPFKGSCVDNVLKHGVGALNIDESRVSYADEADLEQTKGWSNKAKGKATHKYFDGNTDNTKTDYDEVDTFREQGRFPSNVIGEVEDYQKYFYNPEVSHEERHEPIVMARKPFKGSCVDNVLEHGVGALNIDATRVPTDEQIQGGTTNSSSSIKKEEDANSFHMKAPPEQWKQNEQGRFPSNVIGEVEDYQKYFYCPKVSRKERHAGFETKDIAAPNNHPTVKPVELMKYLIKLVTPAGGLVLDPFNGSGSTGMACVEMGYEYVGCELDPEYVEIANARISAWEKKFNTPAHKLFD